MNDDLQLLENIANFLKQGYLIKDVLNLCLIIHQTEKIKLIEQNLVAGKAFDEVIIEIDFDNTFIEYFKFFRFKNNISTVHKLIKKNLIIFIILINDMYFFNNTLPERLFIFACELFI